MDGAARQDERMHENFTCNGSNGLVFHYGGEIQERYRERDIPLPRSSVMNESHEFGKDTSSYVL